MKDTMLREALYETGILTWDDDGDPHDANKIDMLQNRFREESERRLLVQAGLDRKIVRLNQIIVSLLDKLGYEVDEPDTTYSVRKKK